MKRFFLRKEEEEEEKKKKSKNNAVVTTEKRRHTLLWSILVVSYVSSLCRQVLPTSTESVAHGTQTNSKKGDTLVQLEANSILGVGTPAYRSLLGSCMCV